MTEAPELLAELKSTYGEIYPGRDPEAMRYDDSLLALGVTLSRKFEASLKQLTATNQPRAGHLRTRTLDRFEKHNSADPE